ncbi:MAG: hypothetical protein PHN22_04780 [Candidatus ainarchaeum sp.]|nr:hypothetical protein [Candidatus ainarchaeum sp.]
MEITTNAVEAKNRFEGKPLIEHKLKDINFLYNKLYYLKERTFEEYNQFLEEIQKDKGLEFIRENLKKSNVKKTQNEEIKATSSYIITTGNPKFLYLVDSFILDYKRIIEYSLRLSIVCYKHYIKKKGIIEITDKYGREKCDFSLDNLLKSFSQSAFESDFSKYITREQPWFKEYIITSQQFLQTFNSQRTDLEHYKILNLFKINTFKIEYHWNSVLTFDDPPKITIEQLKIFDKEIQKFITEYIENLELFIKIVTKLIYKLSETK